MSLLKKVLTAAYLVIKTHRAPRVLAEPIRAAAHKVIAAQVTVTAALVMLTQMTHTFPAGASRDRASMFVGYLGIAAAVVTKIAAEVYRSKVFSPETHMTDVAKALQNGPTDPATISK